MFSVRVFQDSTGASTDALTMLRFVRRAKELGFPWPKFRQIIEAPRNNPPSILKYSVTEPHAVLRPYLRRPMPEELNLNV